MSASGSDVCFELNRNLSGLWYESNLILSLIACTVLSHAF